MSAEHKRPLAAFILLAMIGVVVMGYQVRAHGLAGVVPGWPRLIVAAEPLTQRTPAAEATRPERARARTDAPGGDLARDREAQEPPATAPRVVVRPAAALHPAQPRRGRAPAPTSPRPEGVRVPETVGVETAGVEAAGVEAAPSIRPQAAVSGPGRSTAAPGRARAPGRAGEPGAPYRSAGRGKARPDALAAGPGSPGHAGPERPGRAEGHARPDRPGKAEGRRDH